MLDIGKRKAHLLPMSKQKKRGRPPGPGGTMEHRSMVRLSQDDLEAFELEARRLEKLTGVCVTVSSYLRMAGRAMLGKKLTP